VRRVGAGCRSHKDFIVPSPADLDPVKTSCGALSSHPLNAYGRVGLAGRAPEFGALAPNPGQRFVAPAATVVVAGGAGYVIYEAFDDD
jgi:murein DD-endopeptidase MepM/ murein hydrolase activator NlpD